MDKKHNKIKLTNLSFEVFLSLHLHSDHISLQEFIRGKEETTFEKAKAETKLLKMYLKRDSGTC